MKIALKILFPLIIIAVLFSSCHQRGCTDAKAINYNVTADEDDGSCIVCDTIFTKLASKIIYLKDKKFGSPHYNQNVARFTLDQNILTPSDKNCGKENSVVSLTIESLVTQKMYVYYRIEDYSGPVNFYNYNDLYVYPDSITDGGTVLTNNNPPFISIGLDSIIVTTQSDIIYF